MLPWKNLGDTSATKRAHLRTLERLQATGLVTTGSRTAGLTEQGLTIARDLAGRLQLADCLPGVNYMFHLIESPHAWTDQRDSDRWLSESSIAGGEAWPRGEVGKSRLTDSAIWVCNALRPLQIAGLVAFDYAPHYESPLFTLTPKGYEQAAQTERYDQKDWLKLAARFAEADSLEGLIKLKKKKAIKHLAKDACWFRVLSAFYDSFEETCKELLTLKAIMENAYHHHLSVMYWPGRMIQKAPENS